MRKNKEVFSVRILVITALLIAISIILTRFFSISMPTLRIGFGDVPVILGGMFFGPLVGAVTGALSDFIGYLINPMGGTYFPGFTVSAALRGAIPGFLFIVMRNKPIKVNYSILSGISVLSISLGFILSTQKAEALSFFNWSVALKVGYIAITFIFAILPFIVLKFAKVKEEQVVYSLDKILFAVTLGYIVISILLNTYWLALLYGKAFMAMLPSRVITGLVIIPIHSIVIWALAKPLSKIEASKPLEGV